MWRLGVVMLLLAGCFSPAEHDGVVLCGEADSCPDGFQCLSGACYAHSTPTVDSGVAPVALDSQILAPDATAQAAEPDAAPHGHGNGH